MKAMFNEFLVRGNGNVNIEENAINDADNKNSSTILVNYASVKKAEYANLGEIILIAKRS